MILNKTGLLIGASLLAVLLALPAVASDYTLGVFGNANEDDTINMQDVTYTELIILEYRDQTELSDAKHDGKINMQDVTQIELVILGKEKELTLLDTADRIVTVNKPIKRLVVCFPHPLETLRSIKVPKDIVVGVAKDRLDMSFFSEFDDVSSIGWRWTPDIEAILNLQPDAVIIYPFRMDKTLNVLESADIPALQFHCNMMEIHPEEARKLGYIFGNEEEAEEYLGWRENVLNSIEEVVEGITEDDRPDVYFETSFEASGYSSHSMSEILVTSAGGKDIFAGRTASEVDPEAVVDRNPDIIVKTASWELGGYGVDVDGPDGLAKLKEVRDGVMSRPELRKVKAVEDEEVYILTVHLVSFYPVSGCRDFVATAYLAKWFHPELFGDLDPEAIHQEYLTEFQGLEIDLDEKGVFVYPPLEES